MGIIKIQSMGYGPIDQCCVHYVRLQAMAPNRGLGFSAKILDGLHQDLTQGLIRPSQGHSHEIQDAALSLVNHFFRERPIGCFMAYRANCSVTFITSSLYRF